MSEKTATYYQHLKQLLRSLRIYSINLCLLVRIVFKLIPVPISIGGLNQQDIDEEQFTVTESSDMQR
jgi:hypothetical protein